MYKNSFLHPCKKSIHLTFTKINRVRPTAICNVYTKFELDRMYRLDAICSLTYTHTYTHIHTYITAKIALMNSADLKTCNIQTHHIVYVRKVKISLVLACCEILEEVT